MDFPQMDRLAMATAQLGLPRLVGVRHVETSGPLDRWRLAFDGTQADLVLTRVLWSTGRDPLQCVAAAIAALEPEDIPAPTGIQVFPDGSMDHPTALATAPAGMPSKALVLRAPKAMGQVLASMGKVVADLQEIYQVRFGIRGDLGQFAPTRSTWRDEWRAMAEIQLVNAQAAGLGDLGVVSRLWARLEEGIAALPDTVTPTVVHFGLRPASLRFHVDNQGMRLAYVGEFEEALAGDPLAAWAPLLCRFGSGEMAAVLGGYGAERARELLDSGAMDAIQVYARTRALSQLRDAAQRARNHPSDDAARAIEKAVGLCERATSDTWAADLFRAALDNTPSEPMYVSEPPETRIERRALLGLASGPALPSDRTPYVLSALASADLARHVEGENAAIFVKKGDMFVEGANLPSEVLPVLPIADRDAWRASLIAVAERECAQAGPAMGLALLASGLAVVDRLGDQLSSRSLRGLEALVLATLARESARRSSAGLEANDRVAHGLLGQDAALRLGLAGLADAWAAQIVDALDVLAVGKVRPKGEEGNPSMEALLPVLTRPMTYRGRALLTIPAAAAALRLEEQGKLVDKVATLFQAAFVG